MMHLNDITSRVKGQHLSLSERIEIQSWKRLDKSNRFIARTLGRSHSTINDEIKRGTAVQKKLVNGKAYYLKADYAETGHLLYKKHREVCKPQYKLLKVEGFIKYAKQKIQVEKWSPDIIVGRAIELGTYEPHERICAKTLYRLIEMQVGTLDEDFDWLCYEHGMLVTLVENIGSGVREFCYFDGNEYHVILNNRYNLIQQRKTVIHEVIHIMENHYNHPKHDTEKCEKHVAMIIQELKYKYA